MLDLFSSNEMAAADRFTIKDLRIPELLLIELAAAGVTSRLFQHWGSLLPKTRGLIMAGNGNNGADALAVARLLHLSEIPLKVILPGGLKGSSAHSIELNILNRLNVTVSTDLRASELNQFDWIVDGLLGTGLSRNIEGKFEKAIRMLNEARKWVLSIDIPSGLSSDTGNVMGLAVQATETVAIGFIKRGHCTGESANYRGKVFLNPIQIPRKITGLKPSAFLFQGKDAKELLPNRLSVSHKGTFGHLYIWRGTEEKEGASALAALSGLRAGAGLVTLLCKEGRETSRVMTSPEVMIKKYNQGFFTQTTPSAGVFGPGQGTSSEQENILRDVLKSEWKLVLDGDALTLIAKHIEPREIKQRIFPTILTPHPKEAARLLNCSTEQVQADRFQAVHELHKKYGGTIVLKGKGSIVYDAEKRFIVIDKGDSSLAKAGSGDILSGIIGSFLAQGLQASHAAMLGCYVHGRAAEILSRRSGEERTHLSSEVAASLSDVYQELSEWNESSIALPSSVNLLRIS